METDKECLEVAGIDTCMDAIGDKFVAEGVHLHQRRQPGRVAVVAGVDARGVPAPTPGLAGEAPPPPPPPLADMEEHLFLLWHPWRRRPHLDPGRHPHMATDGGGE